MTKEIKISFLRRLTGRQDPSIKRIIASLIIVILFFLIDFFVGFYLNQAMIEPNANVVYYPFIEDHASLPITITNGPKEITNVTLRVKTCYMNKFETFNVPNLIPNEEYLVHLKDEETIIALDELFEKKVICDQPNITKNTQCYFDSYVVEGKLYAPPQECRVYECGLCEYKIILEANEFEEKLIFNENFTGLVKIDKYKFEIVPNRFRNVTKEGLSYFEPIGIIIIEGYELCMIKYNDTEHCKIFTKGISNGEPVVFNTIISARDESLGKLNLTVTYTKKKE